jgi:2-iminobutanoate/2-iminopropanoate deaminase
LDTDTIGDISLFFRHSAALEPQKENNCCMKKPINTQKAPNPQGPCSQAIEAGGFVFVSGQLPLDPKTGQPVGQTIQEQTRATLKNLKAILEAAELDLEDVLQVRVYLADLSEAAQFNEVYAAFFDQGTPPARELIGNVGLPKGAKLEISAVGLKKPPSNPNA